MEPALPGLSLCVVLLQQQQAGHVRICQDTYPHLLTTITSHTHLVSLQQSLGPAHIVSQFVSGHKGLHGTEPGHEVSVLAQEPLEVGRVHKLVLTCFRLGEER